METVAFHRSEDIKEVASNLFEEQRARIAARIPQAEIHHIGGTSIPGLLTKGDLDISVRVNGEDFSASVDALKNLYEINQPENWTDTYASFKDDNSFALPLGIQLTVKDSGGDHFLLHRQKLLESPVLVEKFNELKRQFEGKSMEAYRAAKSLFLEELR